jgi:integrase
MEYKKGGSLFLPSVFYGVAKRIRKKEKIYPGNNAKTIKNKLGNIRKFLYDVRVLYGEDFIPDMPLFERIKIREPEITIMDDDKRLLAISKLPLEHQPFFSFMRLVGVRPCEAAGFKNSHILRDGDTPYWLVQAAFSDRHYRQRTKTKNRWTIPLTQEEIEIIKSVPRSLQTDFVFYWIDNRDKKKHKPYRQNMISRLWKSACVTAGVDYISPYPSFRHTTITKWLDDGMLEEDASLLVGHKCRSTIRKYDRSKRIARLMKAKMGIK